MQPARISPAAIWTVPLAVGQRLAAGGLTATFGYWDAAAESAESVFAAYSAILNGIATSSPGAYASIKLPSLRFSGDLLAALGELREEDR